MIFYFSNDSEQKWYHDGEVELREKVVEKISNAGLCGQANSQSRWHHEHDTMEVWNTRSCRQCVGRRSLLIVHGLSCWLSIEASKMLFWSNSSSSKHLSIRHCLPEHSQWGGGLEACFNHTEYFGWHSKASQRWAQSQVTSTTRPNSSLQKGSSEV